MVSGVFPELGLGQWRLARASGYQRCGRRGACPLMVWDGAGRRGWHLAQRIGFHWEPFQMPDPVYCDLYSVYGGWLGRNPERDV